MRNFLPDLLNGYTLLQSRGPVLRLLKAIIMDTALRYSIVSVDLLLVWIIDIMKHLKLPSLKVVFVSLWAT